MRLGVEVKLNSNFRRKRQEQLGDFVEGVIGQTRDVAAKYTPRRSGSAARAWRVEGQGVNAEAVNNKPYIKRLEAGSSDQAPQGITKPTLKEIRRRRIVK